MRAFATLGVLSLLCSALPAQAQVSFKDSLDGKRAASKGAWVLRELRLPSSGEKAKLARVVARSKNKALSLQWLDRNPDCDPLEDTGCFTVHARRALPGTKLKRLEWLPFGPGGRQLLAVTEGYAPDERTENILVFRLAGGAFSPSLEHTFVLGRSPDVRDGDKALPGLRVEETDKGPQLVWVEGPSVLSLPGRDQMERFAVGRKEVVFDYDVERQAFVLGPSRIIDLYPWLSVERVMTSGQALSEERPDGGADHDLSTSWRVPSSAERPSIAVKFKEHGPLRMVRIIPGCLGYWARTDRPRRMRLTLGNGQSYLIDTARLQPPPAGVRALGRFALQDGEELFLFFDEPQQTDRAKLEILDTKKSRAPRGKRIAEICLTELGFY